MSARTGRGVSRRVRVRGWLRTESPLHVGGLSDSLGGALLQGPTAPLPIAFDGLGRLYVPGTSLAGVLRSWSRGAGPESAALAGLWGNIVEGTDEGRASRVIVADALVTSDHRLGEHGLPASPLDPALLEFRPSVGIDRVTGAAAQEILHGRAVVPAGCFVRLEIDVESGTDAEAESDEAWMGALLDALQAGDIRVGAATSRGLGMVRLIDDPLDIVVDRLDSPEGLLAVLRDDPARRRSPASLREAATPDLPPRRDVLEVRVAWRPMAPVMVRGTSNGLVVGTLPLTTRVGRRHLTLALPGASLKGALRAHAELVEHTARGPDAAFEQTSPSGSAADHSAAFRARLDRLPAVRALFGAARDDTPDRRMGALRAEECTAEVTIPESLWRTVTGGDEPPRGDSADDGEEERVSLPEAVLDRLEDHGIAKADHVALDRWTGGAADGRLFSVLEPHAVEWGPIRLTVDLTRLGDDRDPALALLLLTLRDLAAGRIPLGALVNRGFGDVEVTEVTLTGGRWPEPASLDDVLGGSAAIEIGQAWTDYLAQEV